MRNPWIKKLAERLGISYAYAAELMSDAESDLHATCDNEADLADIRPEDVYQLAADRHL